MECKGCPHPYEDNRLTAHCSKCSKSFIKIITPDTKQEGVTLTVSGNFQKERKLRDLSREEIRALMRETGIATTNDRAQVLVLPRDK